MNQLKTCSKTYLVYFFSFTFVKNKINKMAIIKDKLSEVFALINKTETIENHSQWAERKHYASEHRSEYRFSIIFFFLCAGIGCYFGMYALTKILADNQISAWYYDCMSILIMLLIYAAEYSNISQIARILRLNKEFAKVPVSIFRWGVAIFLSSINIILVLLGTYYQTKITDTSEKVIISNFSKDSLAIAKQYQSQIYEYNQKISEVKKMFSWKGKLAANGQKLVGKYESEIIRLNAEKTAILKQNYDYFKETKIVAKSELNSYIGVKLGFSILIELIILICCFSIGNYRASVYIFEISLQKTNEMKNKNTSEKVIISNFSNETHGGKNGNNNAPKPEDREKKN
jgi:hypothetical protein